MKVLNSLEDILAVKKKDTKVIAVPDWDNHITIRKLSAGAVIDLESECADKDGELDNKKWVKLLLMHGVVNEDGDPIFNLDNIDKVFELSAGPLQYISDQILKFNNLNESTDKKAKN